MYSKFSYKAMEYDLMVNANHDNNPHIGNKSIELYKFPDKTIERIAAFIPANTTRTICLQEYVLRGTSLKSCHSAICCQ